MSVCADWASETLWWGLHDDGGWGYEDSLPLCVQVLAIHRRPSMSSCCPVLLLSVGESRVW